MFFLVALINLSIYAQKYEAALDKVREGVELHDKGKYEEAIKKYEEALNFDKYNDYALSEMAFSYFMLKEYKKAMKHAKKAIEKNPGSKILDMTYVTYGNSLDHLGKSKESIEKYDEGIKLYPNSYQLYYNKGVTLTGMNKIDEAIICFQKSGSLNYLHGSSHYSLGAMEAIKNNRINALLAYSYFLMIEPQGERAKYALSIVKKIMKGNIKKTGEQSFTINIQVSDTTDKSNFSMVELMLDLNASLDSSEQIKDLKLTEVNSFIRKFDMVCSSMSTGVDDNDRTGFYWEFYAPLFVEMNSKNFVEPFSYLIFFSSDDDDVENWIKENEEEIKKLYKWLSEYLKLE